MKLLPTDPEGRLAVCWLGALFGPFPILSAYMLFTCGVVTPATVQGYQAVICLSVFVGLACIATMPIRAVSRMNIACLYAPVIWFALEVYGVFFGIIVCNEVP